MWAIIKPLCKNAEIYRNIIVPKGWITKQVLCVIEDINIYF